MYSNHQNGSRSAPGRKKRRETFTAKQMSPNSSASVVSDQSSNGSQAGPRSGRNKSRVSTSPVGRRSRNVTSPVRSRPTPSPVGRRRTSSVPGRTPSSAHSPPRRNHQPSSGRQSNPSPGRRRKPRVNAPVTSRETRSEEFRPRPTTTTTRTTAPPPVCKPTASATKPRQSRLAGFSLTCHAEGCDGGANCLHI